MTPSQAGTAFVIAVALLVLVGAVSTQWATVRAAERATAQASLVPVVVVLRAAVERRLAALDALAAFVRDDPTALDEPQRLDRVTASIVKRTVGIASAQARRLTADGDVVLVWAFPRSDASDARLGASVRATSPEVVERDHNALALGESLYGPLPFIHSDGSGLVAKRFVKDPRGADVALVMLFPTPDIERELRAIEPPPAIDAVVRTLGGAVVMDLRSAPDVELDEAVALPVRLSRELTWEVAGLPAAGFSGLFAASMTVPWLISLLSFILVFVSGMLVVNRNAERTAFSHQLTRREAEAWKDAIRVMHHEVGNTLGPIRSLARSAERVLDEKLDPAKAHEALQTIAQRAEDLRTFLEGYAMIARLPAPRVVDVHLPSFVAGLAGVFPFVVDDVPVRDARFDPILVRQAILNLLKNAHESGGPADGVSLRVVARGGRVVFQVFDRGQGISAAAADRATARFYSTKKRGTGIGLSLCREVAEAHGGEIALEAREGGGAVAALSLPLRAVAVDPDGPDGPDGPDESSPAPRAP